MSEHVVVGLSGGVDSSVAALLLKQQGYRVTGLFMKNWEDDDTDEYCSSRIDLVDAVSIAERIGIEIEVVNFAQLYKEKVFSNFLSEYRAGRTPNPDILCNAEIKFRAFMDHAIAMGATQIATGHYAQIRQVEGLYQLLRAEDSTKDQSYFLYRLTQDQLAKTLFPLGTYLKREVRKIAETAGFPNARKKDSTGICFIGERPFREFLQRYLPKEPGDICTLAGEVIGRHHGLMYYTLGQRQGLGIGGRHNSDGQPWYVVAKNLAKNQLMVVQGHTHPNLLSHTLEATQLHWIAHHPPRPHWVYNGKVRYQQTSTPCEIEKMDHHACQIYFAQPQWAVTPGQSVVLYESNVCLGGGIIT